MAIALSTLGAKVYYTVGNEDTIPSSGYIEVLSTDTFDSSKTYYTKDGSTYTEVTISEFTEGTTYYTASEYIQIPQVISIPDLDPEPEGIDVTPLENTRMRTYIPGLKDLGGNLPFQVNMTNELVRFWNGSDDDDTTDDENSDSVMYKYENLDTGKALWLTVVHPKLDLSVYFRFIPVEIGLPGFEVNTALQPNLNMTPVSEIYWANKPPVED